MSRALAALMSSSTPPDYARWLAEPSIVVDPCLFQRPRPRCSPLGRRLLAGTLLTLRTVASAAIVGVTLFSVVHADKWLARGHGSVHAAEARDVLSRGARRTGTTAARALQVASPAPVVAIPEPLGLEAPLAPAPDGVAMEAALPAEPSRSREHLRDTLRAARRLLAQRHHEAAEAAYRSVLAQRARHPGALAGLARVALARGDLDTALHSAQLAVHSAPAHAVYHLILGEVLTARCETSAADLEYATAARLSAEPLDRAAKLLPENPF